MLQAFNYEQRQQPLPTLAPKAVHVDLCLNHIKNPTQMLLSLLMKVLLSLLLKVVIV
jgi:hypothetical protein